MNIAKLPELLHRLVLEIDIGQRLSVGVAHGAAGGITQEFVKTEDAPIYRGL